jgi:hypothetical protein
MSYDRQIFGAIGSISPENLPQLTVFCLHLPESLIQSAPGSDFNMLFTQI